MGPNGVLYRLVPLYTGQPAGVPVVSSTERFHCIQDSQLGHNGVLYREVPLYTGQPAGSRGSTVRMYIVVTIMGW